MFLVCVGARQPARPPTAPEAADADTFAQGVQALRRGLHAKAWELLRAHYRSDPAAAWESAPLQESLCVCAVKMRKATVAISACRNASDLRPSSHSAPLTLLMARGEARMMADQPSQAWDEFRRARDTAVRGEALKQEKEAEEGMRRCEQALLVSFTRQRGAIVATAAQELKRGSFASLAEQYAGSAVSVVPHSVLRRPPGNAKLRDWAAPRTQEGRPSRSDSRLGCVSSLIQLSIPHETATSRVG